MLFAWRDAAIGMQIVGGSLSDADASRLRTNFVSSCVTAVPM